MAKAKDIRKPKPVEITIGGQAHSLLFDLNSFALIEDAYGDIDEAMKHMEKGSIKAIRALIWAGIGHAHLDDMGDPTITLKEVGAMVQLSDLQELSQKLGEALQSSMPDPEDENKGPLDHKKAK